MVSWIGAWTRNYEQAHQLMRNRPELPLINMGAGIGISQKGRSQQAMLATLYPST